MRGLRFVRLEKGEGLRKSGLGGERGIGEDGDGEGNISCGKVPPSKKIKRSFFFPSYFF